ncbi:MAG: DUF393 domain-containing protein [Taibaiella sp.]|nr:DUF393 domain-containing protein [Taibaiella sp.]
MPLPPERPVLFFDGVCNFCNTLVQLVLKHDKKQQFLFAPLQSPLGKEVLSKMPGSNKGGNESAVLYYKGQYYTKGNVALKIASLLGGWWKLTGIGYLLPLPLRNRVYDIVARNRYKWFGKRDSCMVPAADVKSRFLSE